MPRGLNCKVVMILCLDPKMTSRLALAHYRCDFMGEYLVKDNCFSDTLRIVSYGRSALDMAVDPVRYGISSPKGTRFPWKLVRKPDLVILLYEGPQPIVAQKKDLDSEEVERQLEEWLRLAEEGEIDAIIRVDAPLEEIGRRVNDLIASAFVKQDRRNLTARMSPEETLDRICSILTHGKQGEGRFGINPPEDGHGKSSRNVAELAIVPRRKWGSLLIPLGPRRVAASSLRLSNSQRPVDRLARKTLSVGLRLGLAQPLLRRRFSLSIQSNGLGKQTRDTLLQEHLKAVLGYEDLHIALSSRLLGARRRDVIQVMDRAGRVLGYVKVGWNEETIHLLKNEERVLRHVSQVSFTTASIPRILYADSWDDLYLLMVSPPEGRVRKPLLPLTCHHLEFLKELASFERTVEPLSESVFWQTLEDKVKGSEGISPYHAHILRWGMEAARKWFAGVHMPLGWKHGDFSLAHTLMVDGKLFVYDWERAQRGSPPGGDAFDFLVQKGVFHLRQKPAPILQSVLKDQIIQQYLGHIGLEVEWLTPLLVLYVLDVLSTELMRSGHEADLAKQRGSDALSRMLAISLNRKWEALSCILAITLIRKR